MCLLLHEWTQPKSDSHNPSNRSAMATWDACHEERKEGHTLGTRFCRYWWGDRSLRLRCTQLTWPILVMAEVANFTFDANDNNVSRVQGLLCEPRMKEWGGTPYLLVGQR